MFGNSWMWQRSGEIVIMFATLTALGALTRSASADPSWLDERALIETVAKPAAEAKQPVAEAVPLMDPVAGPSPADFLKPAPAMAAAVPSVLPKLAAAPPADLDLNEDLPYEGRDPKQALTAPDKALIGPRTDSDPIVGESKKAEPTEATAVAQPARSPDVGKEGHAAAETPATSHRVARQEISEEVTPPNVGIVCLAGCNDTPASTPPLATKVRTSSLAARLTDRFIRADRGRPRDVKAVAVALRQHPTQATTGGNAIWPKRHPLCIANCAPAEKQLTEAVYATVPGLRQHLSVAIPEAWLGVPLIQVANRDSLTVTGAMRSTSLSDQRFPGILRSVRSR